MEAGTVVRGGFPGGSSKNPLGSKKNVPLLPFPLLPPCFRATKYRIDFAPGRKTRASTARGEET